MTGTVYIVDDQPTGGGNADMYGVFSTREKAEAWIQRQRDRGYQWSLNITEYPLDEAEDLGR